jgi:hypothetical protein
LAKVGFLRGWWLLLLLVVLLLAGPQEPAEVALSR